MVIKNLYNSQKNNNDESDKENIDMYDTFQKCELCNKWKYLMLLLCYVGKN